MEPRSLYVAALWLLACMHCTNASPHQRVYTLTDLHTRSYKRTLIKRSDQSVMNSEYPSASSQSSINAFSINVQCTLLPSVCLKIQHALQRTLQRVAQVVYLPVTVNIQCNVASACIAGSKCSFAFDGSPLTVLASAAPSRMVQLTPESALNSKLDGNYLYPSALAKQYSPEAVNFNSQTDIDMTINGDVNWWFWSGESRDQEDVLAGSKSGSSAKVYDLEQIALHELCHGLGFVSGWFNWMTEYPNSLLPGFVEEDDAGYVTGLSPQYIFDKWLVGNKLWMGDYAAAIYNSTTALSSNGSFFYQDWLDRFNTSDANILSQQLFTSIATTPSALLFLFQTPSPSTSKKNDKGYAVLYTPEVFSSGSSISHVDANTYFATGDYLMRPFGTSGVGVEGYRPMSVYGPVGIAVLQIMRTMGYATALGPL